MANWRQVICVVVAVWLGWPLAGHASQICNQKVVGMNTDPYGNQTPILQNECYWQSGGIAIDPNTRAYYASWNYPDNESVANKVVGQCGQHCVWAAFQEDYAWIALGEDGSYGISSRNAKGAINACNEAGGRECAVVLTASSSGPPVYHFFGALAHDPVTGKGGYAWDSYSATDARAGARQHCNSTQTCWGYAFQERYGAIAKGPDGRLFGGSSNFTEGRAQTNAVKYCKKETGSDACSVVISGASRRGPAEQGQSKGLLRRLMGD